MKSPAGGRDELGEEQSAEHAPMLAAAGGVDKAARARGDAAVLSLLATLVLLAPPLPEGAVRRIGTPALRLPGEAKFLDVDATRALVVERSRGVHVFDLKTGARSSWFFHGRGSHGHAALLDTGFVWARGTLSIRTIHRVVDGGERWRHELKAGHIGVLAGRGQRIAWGGESGVWVAEVREHGLEDVRRVGHTGFRPEVMRFSADARRLAVADHNAVARVFDLESGQVHDLEGLENLTDHLDFDGEVVAGGSDVRSEAGLIGLGRRELPRYVDVGLHGGPVALSPRWLAAAQSRDERAVLLYDRENLGAAPRRIDVGGGWVRRLRFVPDGRLAVLTRHRLHLFDVTGARVPDVPGPMGAVTALAFSPDGRWIYAGGPEAREAFSALKELYPFDAEPLIGQAIAAGLLGDSETTIIALRDAMRDDPNALASVAMNPSLERQIARLLDRREAAMNAAVEVTSDDLFVIATLRYLLDQEAIAFFTIEEAVDAGDTAESTLNLRDVIRDRMYDNLYGE